MTTEQLYQLVLDRSRSLPEGSSTTRLFQAGQGAMLEKLVEETYETGLALETQGAGELALEVSQCLYYLTCLLVCCKLDEKILQAVVVGDVQGDRHDLAKQLMRSAARLCQVQDAAGMREHATLLGVALRLGGATMDMMQEKL